MWGCCRAWVTEAMCCTELMRRLAVKSSRCSTGAPEPSPDESATAPVPHQRANSGLSVEPGRVADVAQQGGCWDGADAVSIAQGGAAAVEQFVDEAFKAANLAARSAVLVDEPLEPFKAVRAGWDRSPLAGSPGNPNSDTREFYVSGCVLGT